MYRGDLVEFGPTAKVLGDPDHSYTRSLISAVPRSDVKLKTFFHWSVISKKRQRWSRLILRNHWLGQSQDQRDYTGALLEVEKRQFAFCD